MESSNEAASVVASQAVGLFPQSSSVEHDGSLSYQIPIEVPQGRAGVQPDVALVYSSGAGNGIAGVGWTLAGSSEIHRCGSRVARDGTSRAVEMGSIDNLCLDGQRLVLVEGPPRLVGAVYHTERESFAQITITAVDDRGPLAFEVRTRDGAILTYGGDVEGVLDATPRQVTGEGIVADLPYVRTGWLLRRRADRSGNWMSYEYARLATSSSTEIAEPLLESIEYTGLHTMAPNRRVAFVYETRTDADVNWQGSVQRKQTRRLARVETYAPPSPGAAPALVRKYELAYGWSAQSQRSLLSSVRVCDAAGACLPRSSFSYGAAAPSHARTSAGTVDVVGPEEGGLLVGDVTGEGTDDLVYRGPSDRWYVRLSNGTTLGAPVEQPELAGVRYALLSDFDGDGDADIVFIRATGSDSFAYVLAYDGWYGTFSKVLAGPIPANDSELRAVAGFGRRKLAFGNDGWSQWSYGPGAENGVALTGSLQYQSLARTNVDLRAAQMIDLDGDGQSELLVPHDSDGDGHAYYDGIHVRGSQSAAEVMVTNLLHDRCNIFADVNGDGLVDVIHVGTNLPVRLNHGKGIFGPVSNGLAGFAGMDHCATYAGSSPVTAGPDIGVRVIDYNRDGRDDLLLVGRENGSTSTTVRVLVSRGSGFEAVTIGGASLVPAWSGDSAAASVALDLDGDGLSDFIQIHPTTKELGIHRLTGARPDLLVRVTNEHAGVQREVVYAPAGAARSDGMSCDAEQIYPRSCATRGPTVVVEERRGDGAGGLVVERTHRYLDAQLDREGDGFLGFLTHEVGEVAQGRRATYRRTSGLGPLAATGPGRYPFVGQFDNAYIENVGYPSLTTWASSTLTVARPYGGATYLPLVTGTFQTTWEMTSPYTGTQTGSARTTSTYDAFGNETRRETTRGDANTEVVEHTFANDASSGWTIGKLIREQVTSTAPGGTATRVSTYQYDPITGNLIGSVREPEGGAAERLQTQHDYEHGLLRHTVEWGGGPPRVAQYDYDLDAIFVTQTVSGNDIDGWHVSHATWHQGTGAIATVTDPNGLVTRSDVDGFGRVRKVTRPDGTWTAHSFSRTSSEPWIVTTTQSDGASAAVRHDRRGRPVRSDAINALGTTTSATTAYDNADRVVAVSRPFTTGGTVYLTRREYDVAGRALRTLRHDGTVLEWNVYNGRLVDHYVENGAVDVRTQSETDLGGAVIATRTFPDGPGGAAATTTFQHGPFGTLRRVTDPAGNAVVMTHDVLGRQIAIDDPNLGHATTAYDAFGQVTSSTDARGITSTMTYDVWGRRLSRTAPDGTDTWTWDDAPGAGIGALASSRRVDSSGGYQVTRTHAYDALGRLISERQIVADTGPMPSAEDHTFDYSYDAQGRLARIDYPVVDAMPGRFGVTRTYGPYGHLTAIRDASGAAVWTATARDIESRVTSATFGNGLVTNRTFDPANGWLTATRTVMNISAPWADFHLGYTYTPSGDVATMTDFGQGRTESYSYDGADRLTSSSMPGIATQAMTFDTIGNVTSSSAQPGCTREYGTGGVRPNALTRIMCGSSIWSELVYDAAGNVVERRNGDMFTMAWTSFSKPARYRHYWWGAVDYAYDANHRRVRERANGMDHGSPPYAAWSGIWDTTTKMGPYEHRVSTEPDGMNDHIFTVMGVEGPVAQYRWTNITTPYWPGIDGPGWTYLHTDRQGSVFRATDETGFPTEWANYDAWGRQRAHEWGVSLPAPMPTVRKGYTGHDGDEMGLIDMGGRSYEPVLQTFLSPDPIVQAPLHGPSWNRYSYVLNNPLRYNDPTGYVTSRSQEGTGGWNFRAVFGQLSSFSPGVDTWVGPSPGGIASLYGGAFVGGAMGGTAQVIEREWVQNGFVAGAIGGAGSAANLAWTVGGSASGAVTGGGNYADSALDAQSFVNGSVVGLGVAARLDWTTRRFAAGVRRGVASAINLSWVLSAFSGGVAEGAGASVGPSFQSQRDSAVAIAVASRDAQYVALLLQIATFNPKLSTPPRFAAEWDHAFLSRSIIWALAPTSRDSTGTTVARLGGVLASPIVLAPAALTDAFIHEFSMWYVPMACTLYSGICTSISEARGH